jgi:hypothetical protein
MPVRIRLNSLNIRRISVGSATRLVTKVTREVEVLARIAARGPYSTGATASSITSRVYVVGRTVHSEVRAHTWYADMVHGGTRPHVIRPRRAGGKLVFYWRKVGHVVRFDYVSHPGMRPKRFLADPMERVGRRHRFVVFTYD